MRKEFFTVPLALYALHTLSSLAFSKSTRKEMFRRADGASEISGERFDDGVMLHCMHLNHDKSQPDYDDPEAGMVVTVQEHLDYHLEHVGRAEEIGLKECQNDYAIDQLMQTDQRTRAARDAEREELVRVAHEARDKKLAEVREHIRKINPLRQKRRNRV